MRKYEDITQEFVTSKNINDDTLIYHYCPTLAFMSIIEKKQLWLSPCHFMNDKREGSWTTQYLTEYFNEYHNGDREMQRLICDNIKSINNPNYSDRFMCCCCEDGDLLSQWRGYTNDAKGFAVGMKINKFKQDNGKQLRFSMPVRHSNIDLSLTVYPVIYDPTTQKEIVMSFKDFVAKTIVFNHNNPNLDEKKETAYLEAYMFTEHASIFKNSAFEEEKEWRIIYRTGSVTPEEFKTESDSAKIVLTENFRHTTKGISPYYYLNIDPKLELISEVIIGPNNQTRKIDVERFLKSKGFDNIKVKTSSSTYCG